MDTFSAALIVLFIAFGFAAAGDILLRRQSESVWDWHLSFLVGLAGGATLLFPLSLLLPRHALIVLTLAVVALALFRSPMAAAQLRAGFQPRTLFKRAEYRDPVALLFLVVIIFAAVQFLAQNSRLSFLWDGYQIWATKAMILYEKGGLSRDFLTPGMRDRLAEYPPLVPLYGAMVAAVRGEFEWNPTKPIFFVFYISMLLSTFQGARRFLPFRAALAAVAMLALLPAVSTRSNVGGYADMPQAALLMGCLSALLCRSLQPMTAYPMAIAWTIAGVLLVKNEGTILSLVVCAAIAVLWLSQGWKAAADLSRRYWSGLAVVVAAFVLRRCYLWWIDAQDPTYGPFDSAHMEAAVARAPIVVSLCRSIMLDFSEWAVFWPAFLLSVPIILVFGCRILRCVLLGTLAVVLAYGAIFLFTNWDVRLQIEQSFSRLLVHIAPAASILLTAAYSLVRQRLRE